MACKDTMNCPNRQACALFEQMPLMASYWRASYCQDQHTQCERFKRIERGDQVPWDLLPSGALINDTPTPPSNRRPVVRA